MKKVRVAINGLGRIGRAFFKLAVKRSEIQLVAVNDLGDINNLTYLLKYDSVYGQSGLAIEIRDGRLAIAGQEIVFLQEKEPTKLPWHDLAIDVVVETTGRFESYEAAKAHIEAGSRKVVVSAPIKGEPVAGIPGATVLMGINEEKLTVCQITSNASCTTNSVSPVIQILHDAIGIEKAILNTVHGYTATQKLVDAPDARDFRRGRAAAANIVPSTTGAASAVTAAITALADKFDGLAVRVPVLAGSIADITFIARRPTSVEEVNRVLKKAAGEERWKNIFSVTEEPLVSSDIIGSPYASIADLALTKVVGGNLVKVMAWYDNEMGYTHTLVQHVIKTGTA